MTLKGKRVAVISITAPHPVTTGTRIRCQSVITALLDQGCEVTVIYVKDTKEAESSIAAKLGVARAIGLPPVRRPARMVLSLVRKILRTPPAIYSRIPLSLGAILVLRKLAASSPPFDLVVTEYSMSTRIRGLVRGHLHVLDTCDLLSLHSRKMAALAGLLERQRSGADDSFSRLPDVNAPSGPVVTDEEIEDFRRYDALIAIAESEFHALEKLGLPPANYLIPPCANRDHPEKTDYSGLPLFAFTSNIFNVQGFFHLHRLLPRILQLIPDFKVMVSGNPPTDLPESPAIVRVGFVDDINDLYRNASFAIIPVHDGTGQQLKVVEAMSYGLPVAGYRRRIDSSIITNGEEGYVADGEEEFIEAVVRLWNDRDLTAAMGLKGQRKLRSHFSQAAFNRTFSDMLGDIRSRQI